MAESSVSHLADHRHVRTDSFHLVVCEIELENLDNYV